jgi:hypothetical protein
MPYPDVPVEHASPASGADDALVQLVGLSARVLQQQPRVQVVQLARAAQQEVAHLGARLRAALRARPTHGRR